VSISKVSGTIFAGSCLILKGVEMVHVVKNIYPFLNAVQKQCLDEHLFHDTFPTREAGETGGGAAFLGT